MFLDLAAELERQGVSRKVSADMFGMGLRTYLRKLQRLSESSTETGRSLWDAVLCYLKEQGVVSRVQVLRRFPRDDELQVRAVLHDLTESGLVFAAGGNTDTAYRAATEAELGHLQALRNDEGTDELIWVLVYRQGPLTQQALEESSGISSAVVGEALQRLIESGRVALVGCAGEPQYRATTFYVAPESAVGWEAAVFDHYQAVVTTITQRRRHLANGDPPRSLGGSTWTIDVWPGHPLEEEVLSLLDRLREQIRELRARVEAHNQTCGLPREYREELVYVGQCQRERELDSTGDGEPKYER